MSLALTFCPLAEDPGCEILQQRNKILSHLRASMNCIQLKLQKELNHLLIKHLP